MLPPRNLRTVLILSLAGREYFRYQRDHAGASLHFSKPSIGATTKKHVVAFTRRYNYPDGRFAGVADELSATGSARPARHESVTILFTDFSGFTQAVSAMPADRMVGELNEIFEAFDAITDACGVEKIKTIGDAYMAAAGLPKACSDHAQRCVRAGLRMIDYLEERNRTATFKWSLRLGVHSGPVVAGVVGKRKYAYDIWGDTVNVASRMESSGAIGRVNISAYTYDLIREAFDCEYRGKVDAKGKGQIDMYFVKGERQR